MVLTLKAVAGGELQIPPLRFAPVGMTRGEGRLTLKSAIGIAAKCRSLGSAPKEQILFPSGMLSRNVDGRDLTIPPVDWWRG
jgi:hypothetical protein